MLPGLEPYFAKYYDRWLNYSQYICTRLGIRREAYDIMADVLVEFCCKSDDALADLLACEKRGECKLFFSVRKAIFFRASTFARFKKRPINSLEKHLSRLTDFMGDNSDDIPNEIREAEAKFRDDSFVIPTTCSRQGTPLPHIFADHYCRHTKAGHPFIAIRYGAIIQQGTKKIKCYRSSCGAVLNALTQNQMHV